MHKSVLTTTRPPAGTIVASDADRSNPAACGEPRVGIMALFDRNFTCRTSPSSSLDDDLLTLSGEDMAL